MWNRERAKELIKEKGRTREWLAKECRVNTSSLHACLNGSQNPSRAVIALMAIALNVDEFELFSDPESSPVTEITGTD